MKLNQKEHNGFLMRSDDPMCVLPVSIALSALLPDFSHADRCDHPMQYSRDKVRKALKPNKMVAQTSRVLMQTFHIAFVRPGSLTSRLQRARKRSPLSKLRARLIYFVRNFLSDSFLIWRKHCGSVNVVRLASRTHRKKVFNECANFCQTNSLAK